MEGRVLICMRPAVTARVMIGQPSPTVAGLGARSEKTTPTSFSISWLYEVILELLYTINCNKGLIKINYLCARQVQL